MQIRVKIQMMVLTASAQEISTYPAQELVTPKDIMNAKKNPIQIRTLYRNAPLSIYIVERLR